MGHVDSGWATLHITLDEEDDISVCNLSSEEDADNVFCN